MIWALVRHLAGTKSQHTILQKIWQLNEKLNETRAAQAANFGWPPTVYFEKMLNISEICGRRQLAISRLFMAGHLPIALRGCHVH